MSHCVAVFSYVFVVFVTFGRSAPFNVHQQPEVDNNLRQMASLRRPGGTVAVLKSHAVVFKNINGEKEQFERRKEEVQRDGEVVARVQQELDKSGDNPEPHIKTMLDIPEKKLHRVIEHGQKRPIIGQKTYHRALSKEQTPDPQPRSSPRGKPFTSMDMAEYIFWTGDEQGATSAIEEFLEEGILTRDEAIGFLEDIKVNLETLQQQFASEPERPRVRLVGRKYVTNKWFQSSQRTLTRWSQRVNQGITTNTRFGRGTWIEDRRILAEKGVGVGELFQVFRKLIKVSDIISAFYFNGQLLVFLTYNVIRS